MDAEQRGINHNFFNKNLEFFMEQTGLGINDAKVIFETFMDTVLDLMKNIESALVSEDYQAIRRIAHQLKGSSGNLRIIDIFELAKELETSAMEKDKSKCEKIISEMKKLFWT